MRKTWQTMRNAPQLGFAQHIKTDVAEDAGIWTGDATYLVSETLPAGIKKIDAEVVVANCREKGIPLV